MQLEYRLWDKHDRKMIYAEEAKNRRDLLAIGLHGLPIAVDQDSFRGDEVTGWNVDHRYIPMLFTGYTDEIGAKIYQGDFVRFSNHSRVYEVTWGKFEDCCVEGEAWMVEDETLYTACQRLLVVGNSMQNSELISSDTPEKEK